MDVNQAFAIKSAQSMEIFCDGDSSFILGDWIDWEKACLIECRTIPPREFKARPVEKRRVRLNSERNT